ncbi:MAG TPA: hypothetical protein VLV89_13105 [Candidatus Acidoferrum sp.]|nr:hypothetical protein [Candidatus Acidoferrum sp.]
MKAHVFFHDRCFDGTASAAVFTRFFRERMQPAAEFLYTGMTHQARRPFEDSMFDGDDNAIVDFKYSPSPRVTWWFDHHQSAFLTPADADHFRDEDKAHKFYDPSYKSCTKLIADVAQSKFGFNPAPLAELIHWGDIIDGAQYASPEEAVSISEPATQIALVIEAAPEANISARLVPELASKPLAEVVRLPLVAKHLGPLLERHHRSIEILRQRIQVSKNVIYFDVGDLDLEGYNKFIPYLLHPESLYCVSVSASETRSKVSIGSNPWKSEQIDKNLASLAERYGGGGHPKVSAISFAPGDIARARQVAQEIAAELRK